MANPRPRRHKPGWSGRGCHADIGATGCIPNDGDLLDLLAQFAPIEAVRNRILVDNPARLYGFDG